MQDGPSAVWTKLLTFCLDLFCSSHHGGSRRRKTGGPSRPRKYQLDDYLASDASVAEVVREAAAVKKNLKSADLNLSTWISNSAEFLRTIFGDCTALPSQANLHPLTD